MESHHGHGTIVYPNVGSTFDVLIECWLNSILGLSSIRFTDERNYACVFRNLREF